MLSNDYVGTGRTDSTSRPAKPRRLLTGVAAVVAATLMSAVGVLVTAPAAHAATAPRCNSSATVQADWRTQVVMPVATTTTTPIFECTIAYGETGTEVKVLQSTLNRCYKSVIGTALVVDGQFGSKTQAALIKAQRSEWLPQTGKYTGAEAWNMKFFGMRGLGLGCYELEGPVLG
ncbi:peptidoglycan-binding domain-containing protein [Catellatospora sp. NPDC049133]|uniref:peptidoglycan-binding domain-containing protein n=1 Tax=Catellatospora sp. NPDC049133 TaxID=3155499 RepID=UPI0033C04099